MASKFSTIDQAVEAMSRGEIVIVVDAEDRENEGDFICAAEKVTTETVNFMITHGRGQLCMPILPDVSERLRLQPMVEDNTAPLGTNYTVPVDHRTSRTGITAAETCSHDPSLVRSLQRPFRLSSSWTPVPAGGERGRSSTTCRTHRSGC